MIKKHTIFCDIDGTLFVYRKFETYKTVKPTPITNVIEVLNQLYNNGDHVVLTTARPEYLREHTITELSENNIKYHQLVMGLARGTRYLINDNEVENMDRAIAINLIRNEGFKNSDIDKF